MKRKLGEFLAVRIQPNDRGELRVDLLFRDREDPEQMIEIDRDDMHAFDSVQMNPDGTLLLTSHGTGRVLEITPAPGMPGPGLRMIDRLEGGVL